MDKRPIVTVRRRVLQALVPVLLAAVASAGCDLAMSEFNTEETAEWRKSFPLDAGGRVEIININGTISANITNGGISAGDLSIDATGENTKRKLEGHLNGGGPRMQIIGVNGGISLSGR